MHTNGCSIGALHGEAHAYPIVSTAGARRAFVVSASSMSKTQRLMRGSGSPSLRVLIVTPYFPSEADPTSGLFVHEQALALRERGVDPTVLYVRRWMPSLVGQSRLGHRDAKRLPSSFELQGIPVLTQVTPIPPRHHAIEWTGVGALALMNRNRLSGLSESQFDVVHGHEFFPTGQLAGSLARRFRRPLVITVHGTDGTGRTYATHTRRQAIRRMTAQASSVILVGPHLASNLTALDLLGDSTTVIPNGIDPEKGDISGSRPEGWRGKFVIISVSNLVPSKGIADNIHAVADLRRNGMTNCLYVVVGDGPDRPRLEGMVRHLGLESAVQFIGRVANRQALQLVSAADVFSLPSTNEAFGIAYLEAMALGKPAIGIAGQGPEAFMTNGETGFLVSPRAPHELVEVWTALAGDEQLRSTVGVRARRVALTDFTWAANASAMMEIYKRAVSA